MTSPKKGTFWSSKNSKFHFPNFPFCSLTLVRPQTMTATSGNKEIYIRNYWYISDDMQLVIVTGKNRTWDATIAGSVSNIFAFTSKYKLNTRGNNIFVEALKIPIRANEDAEGEIVYVQRSLGTLSNNRYITDPDPPEGLEWFMKEIEDSNQPLASIKGKLHLNFGKLKC